MEKAMVNTVAKEKDVDVGGPDARRTMTYKMPLPARDADLTAYFKEVMRHQETTELEGIVSPGNVDRHKFTRLLMHVKDKLGLSTTTIEQLDVSYRRGRQDYRVEIQGRENVLAFVQDEGVLRALHLSRFPMKVSLKGQVDGFRPIFIDASETRVKLRTETEVVSDRQVVLQQLSKYRQRTYRLKKRFSTLSTDGLFRFDMTVVRSASVENGESVPASGAFAAPPAYEVEIEYVGSSKTQGPPRDPSDVAKTFVRHAMDLKTAMEGGTSPALPFDVVEAVLAGIDRLFPGHHRQFVGPMLVTLERNNLSPNPYNNDCILKGYAVTDKADGERCLLYASADVRGGEVFKLTKNGKNAMRVHKTGMRATGATPFVLDCEHVTRLASGQETSRFLVFDAYAYLGKTVGALPLLRTGEAGLTSRVSCATAAKDIIIAADTTHTVEVKRFYEDVFAGARDILAKQRCGKLPYYTDGLVYTPVQLPVGALYEGDGPHFGGTWEKVFKWKPPVDNSIDFEVRFVGSPVPGLGPGGLPLVQRMDLYVGYQTGQASLPEKAMGRVSSLDALIEAGAAVRKDVSHRSKPQPSYSSRVFTLGDGGYRDSLSSAYVNVDPVTNKPLCRDNSAIENLATVEMVRDEDGEHWAPLRLRKDKERGNDYNTAMNVWRSMCNPVEEDMIIGKVRLSPDAYSFDASDVYYRRNAASWARARAASRVMVEFHNKWVKRMLLNKIFKTRPAASVFDIACGKANDISKYIEHGVATVVGADKSADNIENAVDGAYVRVMELRNGRSGHVLRDKARRVTIAFCEADFGMTIDNAYLDRVVDNDARAVLRLLWQGAIPAALGGKEHHLAPYRGIVRRRFDVVACQFAIHYFFGSKRTLSSFLNNVDNLIKPGGLFVGTCLDGRVVDRAFEGTGGVQIAGTRGGRLVWSVQKLYNKLDEDDTPYTNFGKKIRVFVETINQPIDEYVVDFDLLTSELAARDIRPLTPEESHGMGLRSHTGTFRDVFDEHTASGNRDFIEKISALMTDEEKRYSFMNRWFVFKKASAVAVGE